MKQKKQTKNQKTSKVAVILIIVAVMAIAAGTAFYFYKKRQNNDAKTTSTSKTAQEDYQEGKARESAQSGGASQGGVTDTSGTTQQPPADTSVGTTSTSGAITVWQPVGGSMIGTGETIRGKASVPVVQFRIVDDQVGVIAQGELKVVGGVWSGIMNYKSRGQTGSIQVFSFNDQSVEENNISIPVTFGE